MPALTKKTAVSTQLIQLRADIHAELVGNILAYHMQHTIDAANGGFYGRLSNQNAVAPQAAKGLVQHSRLLWTYAHAYRRLGDAGYLEMADQAFHYLLDHFWDDNSGGFYWLVDATGRPLQTDKYIYGQAFAIYGLSEYYLATGNLQSLETAVALYALLEAHARDAEQGGYFEAFTRDWQPCSANVDQYPGPVVKTMNTHLHILEAYTNLYRTQTDAGVANSLRHLIQWHLDHIIDPTTGHLRLHMQANWQSLHDSVSFGHDIEASWLLWEAAELLDDPALIDGLRPLVVQMAAATMTEGIDVDGGVWGEHHEKHWWAQAEALVGFCNAFQLTGEMAYLTAVCNTWHYIQQYIVDKQYGEWLWGRDAEGYPLAQDKISIWKTPYHNSRACFELMQRIRVMTE